MAKLRPLDTSGRQRRYAEIISSRGRMREELDFKSLRFFSALYRLGNVSPAADALDISQPTGSLLLKNYEIILLTRCLSGSGSG